MTCRAMFRRIRSHSTSVMERSESEKHVFVAEWDEEGVFFYQAFNKQIANWAVKEQRFGGPHFKPDRMTWIKPSLAWVLYRAGYGFKDANQERILKIKVPHTAVAEILSHCSCGHGGGGTVGRVQWDPARCLLVGRAGEPAKHPEQRAIQIGMKDDLSRFYVQSAVSIEDVTSVAHCIAKAHKEAREIGEMDVALPMERPYFPRCTEEVYSRLQLCEQYTAPPSCGCFVCTDSGCGEQEVSPVVQPVP
mmetsp:Transcript_70639/g.155823  ORF Transcript_70639/g.155823 Transcript_70639/m.155823 type:complete len:248 (+) Transcript_70639:50-793(+)